MNAMRATIIFLVAGALLCACGGRRTLPITTNDSSAAPSAQSSTRAANRNLYVASWGPGLRTSSVKVYAPGSTRALRTISQGISAPAALAFDRAGNLYVANGGERDHCVCGPATIAVYAPGATTPLRTISRGVHAPVTMAFDRRGNLFVVNEGAGKLKEDIAVYAAGSTRPIRTIMAGLDVPVALAFDRSNNLYVANNDDIAVYPDGSASPSRTIGVMGPIALAFDHSGNLYVGYQKLGPGFSAGPGVVNVYGPDSSSVMRSIGVDKYAPSILAFDNSGALYVAGVEAYDAYYGTLNGYAAGSSSVLRTIREVGLDPMSIAFDGSNNLYVANCPRECGAIRNKDGVRVYARRATSPSRTIYVSGPVALAFGP